MEENLILLCVFASKCNKSFDVVNAKLCMPQSEASENVSTLSLACSHNQGTGDKNRDFS